MVNFPKVNQNNFFRGYAAFTNKLKPQKSRKRKNSKFLRLVRFRDNDVNLQSHFRCLRAEGEPGHLHRCTSLLPVAVTTVTFAGCCDNRCFSRLL